MSEPSKLTSPFREDQIQWLAGKEKDLAYVDARVVQDRLDEAVGPMNWSTSMSVTGDHVVCDLAIKIGDIWCHKSDGASFSPNDPSGKGAYSDAFKRAAVMWGIGRYLYGLQKPGRSQSESVISETLERPATSSPTVPDAKPDPAVADTKKIEVVAFPHLKTPEAMLLKARVVMRNAEGKKGPTYSQFAASINSLDASENQFTDRLDKAFKALAKGVSCTEEEFFDLFFRLSALSSACGMSQQHQEDLVSRITKAQEQGESLDEIMQEAAMLFNAGQLGWREMIRIEMLTSSVATTTKPVAPLAVNSDGTF